MTTGMTLPRPQGADTLEFPPTGDMGGYYILENVVHQNESGVTAASIPVVNVILPAPCATRIGILRKTFSGNRALAPGDVPQCYVPADVFLGFGFAGGTCITFGQYVDWQPGFPGVLAGAAIASATSGYVELDENPAQISWSLGLGVGVAASLSYSLDMRVDLVCLRGAIVAL